MTYESARSITGPFLALLGASAAVVGVTAGLGELLGYALRFISGRIADRTGQYWAVTIFGYLLNLMAVPALALVGNWQLAVSLMFLERIGKAMRNPPRDAMLSFASERMGRGWGFALHEAMDQAGATFGPLIVAVVMYFRNDYRLSFAVLLVPAIISLGVLILARKLYPQPKDLESKTPKLDTHGFDRPLWLYLAATACIAAGFADYPLIAYHFSKSGIIKPEWIPILYTIAMAVDGLAALALGRLFDRMGMIVLIGAAAIAIPFAPLVFFGGFFACLAGAILWGIGMGAQESVMKAAVANMSPAKLRGTAFGTFNMSFGIFWFLGSALMGILYDYSVTALVVFSVVIQLISLPLFCILTYILARK
ncbi:MAG: MFS transporter [Syntrophorhabdaceae bacterium]|nr:MFS transporter [Syntrophorhabdaceae bacterium]